MWHVSKNPAFLTMALSINVMTPAGNLMFVGSLPYLFTALFETPDGIISAFQCFHGTNRILF